MHPTNNSRKHHETRYSRRNGVGVLAVLALTTVLGAGPAGATNDPPFQYVLDWGSPGLGDGQFNRPWGVAVDPTFGNVFVADTQNHRIQVFDSKGNFITKWGRNGGDGTSGTASGEFNRPRGLAVDALGQFVYVADMYNQRIQKFTMAGLPVGNPWTEWEYPNLLGDVSGIDVEYLPNGDVHVYVADRSLGIHVFDSDGNHLRSWSGFPSADDVAVSGDGTVYVPVYSQHKVLRFQTDGTPDGSIGEFGSEDGQFMGPRGVTVGPSNELYVADVTGRIQKFDQSGNFIAKWGGEGSGDGEFYYGYVGHLAAREASFGRIDLYATDGPSSGPDSNSRIQKFGSDTDGDSLPDEWETEGIDVNNDGVIDLDLAALNADPHTVDLFIEIDAMDTQTPANDALDGVAVSFAAQSPTIALHLEYVDDLNVTAVSWPNKWDDFDTFKSSHFGTEAQRNDSNAANILAAKRKVYRYCVFAYNHSNSDSSGFGEIHGNDFAVTLGEFGTSGGTADEKLGTFMHELGHTLGLTHFGPLSELSAPEREAFDADDPNDPDYNEDYRFNFKPNYYSVMNYNWQFPRHWHVANSWVLDYSPEALPDLDESDLDECDGLGGDFYNVVAQHNSEPDPGNTPIIAYASMADGDTVDWNGDDDHTDCGANAVAVDINHVLASHPSSEGELLIGYADWPALDLNFRDDPDYVEGEHSSANGVVEMTWTVAQEMSQVLPPPCPADLFADHDVQFADTFESGSLVAWEFNYATNGEPSGELGVGSWSTDVETAPIECAYSAHLYAQAIASEAPYSVVASIDRTLDSASHLSARIRFDQIQGTGGNGRSFFQIAIINPDTEQLYRYGFSSTGDTGGDMMFQVTPGETFDFVAHVAQDYANKYAEPLPDPFILRCRSFADYAEYAPSGDRIRTAEVALDNVMVYTPTTLCAADLTGDGEVNAADLAQLLGSWGPCGDCEADFNGDGMVNAADLAQLLGAWGVCQ